MTLAPGTRLGPYEIVSHLGAGAMGEVYRARDPRLGRDIAIKVLPAAVAQDADRLRRFEQEARAASAIQHPNLLTVFDVGSDGGIAYLVTELLSGETLRELLLRGPVALEQSIEIGMRLARGLAAAHERGIVHRDLKPENIFVTHEGEVKILDFGLAKLQSSESSDGKMTDAPTVLETSAGTVVGTVGYMAPEQVRGERVDGRTDIFALGVVLHEIVSGARPFKGDTAPDVMSAVLRDPPPPLVVRGSTDGQLAGIVRRCLEKRPEDRFQSARDVGAALGSLANSPPVLVPQVQRRRLHSGRVALLAIVLGSMVAIGSTALVLGLRRSPDRPVASAAAIRSLAVLPFTNVSHDPAQEYFSEGFTDELTTTLSNIGALKVIARTSAASFKGTDKRATQIGRDLGVEALVSGSILRSGERVRISAQLISAESEMNLWAESYERSTSDVLALQAEVARAIATAIAVQLSPQESVRLASTKTVDPRALDAYLRGRALWNQRTETAVREGLAQFEAATRIAPDFALAFAGLADSYIILGVYGFEAPHEVFPAAKKAAQHAIVLDPMAGEPHASLGDIHFHYDWDWEASVREHRKALELAPGFATAYHWGAEPLLLTGQTQEALELLRKARTLDPLSMTIRAAQAAAIATTGDREVAIADLQEAVALDPRSPRARGQLARLLLSSGRVAEALVEARHMIEANPDDLPTQATLGVCLAAAGDAEDARLVLARLDQEGERRFVSSLDRARITAALRDRAQTLRYLADAVAAREGFLPMLPMHDEFEFFRTDAQYDAILKQVGIPQAGTE